ncbi:hypothetical protein CORC01_01527 [Colletotrichum orchidophilum]|uniref:Uncharacterized protein n=1 Tax=Colletotrichum orchidophilum TaxID=1209926 RepID=A0A1G4BPC0_9PEZI|nr:uncharacterized protein CORC01_01527 [Colletotrichum orchidophilum]OHF03143.1 hypothetical protein CORC01_01527 [Colletotrichum orchidophilum]
MTHRVTCRGSLNVHQETDKCINSGDFIRQCRIKNPRPTASVFNASACHRRVATGR